ncbi:MAG: hypothetical protein HXK46_06105, partial [Atopobium sp.]|nr:hypothetical protein [Atopobium sp.]
MSQDTTKKSGTKRKTTPTKRSVEPLKEITAEHTAGALKIFSTKKAEKSQVDRKLQSDQKQERGQRAERTQKSERGQKAERTNKPQFSVASLVELKDNTLDFARNHTKLVVFLGVVIFLLVGLYPPIRGYYHAVREHDELLLNQQK